MTLDDLVSVGQGHPFLNDFHVQVSVNFDTYFSRPGWRGIDLYQTG